MITLKEMEKKIELYKEKKDLYDEMIKSKTKLAIIKESHSITEIEDMYKELVIRSLKIELEEMKEEFLKYNIKVDESIISEEE